jgi:hypothetical protein
MACKQNPINPSKLLYSVDHPLKIQSIVVYCNQDLIHRKLCGIIVYSSKLFLTKSQKTYSSWRLAYYNQLTFLLSQKLGCSKLHEREQEVYSGTIFTLLLMKL